MLPFKRKEKFDKYSYRGMAYIGIALFCLSYEFLFAKEIRPLLIVGFSVVLVVGAMYIWYIKPYDQK